MRALRSIVLSLILVGLAAPRARAQATTVVSFTFDDTFSDQMQAASIFASAGVHGTFYVNSPRIGQAGYLTLAQVTALEAAGNEVGGHTVNHLALTTVPADEQQRQVCDDRAALLGMGLHVTSLAYPHGAAELATQTIVSGCGYGSARDSAGLRSHGPEGCASCPFAETLAPRQPMAIRTPRSVESTNTLAELQQNVTDAEANGGGWVPFVFHHVCDGCNPAAISPLVLEQLVDWVAARQSLGTTVKTVQQVIGGPMNPAVYGQAPTPFIAPDGNLLHNGDLESDADGDGMPDCLEVLSGGSSGSDYATAPAPAAHSGTSATQVGVNAGATASPRLMSTQDLGGCAPSAKGGDVLTFSVYYLSTDLVAPVAYYRVASGWWKTLAMGPVLPAAASWTLAHWTLPALPMDATGVSVGVMVVSTGTLAVDDLVLIDPARAPSDDGGVPPTDAGISSGDGALTDGGAAADASAALPRDAAPADLSAGGETSGCAIAAPRTRGLAWLFALVALVGARRRRRASAAR